MLERALESLGAGLVLSDPNEDGNPIVYANVAFEELTGYDRSELIGRNSNFLQGPDTDPVAQKALRAAIAGGHHARATVLSYRKDGTPFWSEVSLSPLFDSRGRLLYWIEMQTDVTGREAAVQGLREAEERYRRLAENLPGIVTYVADYDGERLHLTYVSPQVEAILGYPRDAWLGDRSVWYEAIHPDDRDRVLAHERRTGGGRRVVLEVQADLASLAALERALTASPGVRAVELQAYAGGHASLVVDLS